MTYLKLLLIACMLLSPLSSNAADEGYGYPIPGSYEASIIGTPPELMPDLPAHINVRKLVVDVFPDREKPPIFFYDKGLRCILAYQKQKAPLVFLIGGAGSNERTDKLVVMTKALYQAGFHVITLPSPTSSNFIVSASTSHVPGDLVEDSADLYRAMEYAWKMVSDDIEVSEFHVGGYSLGAIQSAFVSKLDEERKVFNFRKVLMINPPVSLYSSATRIEELFRQIPGGSKKQGVFFNKSLSKFSEYYRYGGFVSINDDFLYSIYAEKLFSKAETAGLIGVSYRIGLAGMIFSSDVMTNSGYVVPKNRVLSPTDSIFDYFLVSTHLSFFDYFNEYFYPHFLKQRPGLTKQALIESESLRSIEGYLKSSTKFGMITNENDFILTKAELDYLRKLFGDRAKIYPRGGHLGNITYLENVAYMVNFFKKQ